VDLKLPHLHYISFFKLSHTPQLTLRQPPPHFWRCR